MVASRNCNRQALQSLLDETLTRDEQITLESHLERCAECRDDLEGLAADETWWSEASSVLSDGADHLHNSQVSSAFPTGLLEPTEDPSTLGKLDSYEILEVVGQGGMGVVAKAHDRELNRVVAIKVLAPHLASSAAARQRFAREAQAAAAVVHPHVVPIHRVQAAASLPYLVMQFVAGESLQHRIDDLGPMRLNDMLRIALQTARGLAAAHEQGMVHRDVKPSNILLENGLERVLLSDFGLARAADDASLTRSGVVPGTPQYMSPEQAKGQGVDHRTDLFSLGAVLYTMATGHPPFRAETCMAVLHRICTEPPRSIREQNPDLPIWFEQLVMMLLAKDPDARPATASDTAKLLSQALAHAEQPLHEPLPAELEPKKLEPLDDDSEPIPVWRFVAGGALVLAALMLIWAPWRNRQPVEPAAAPTERISAENVNDWDDQLATELTEIDQQLLQLEQPSWDDNWMGPE